MQNGGLSSYVSNPYSQLSGSRLLPTTTNSQSSNATNNTNTASVRNNAIGGLNKNQISELWRLGGAGASGLMPSSGFPRYVTNSTFSSFFKSKMLS